MLGTRANRRLRLAAAAAVVHRRSAFGQYVTKTNAHVLFFHI